LKSSVLITGSRGFLGTHLLLALKEQNYEVYELKGDIRNILDFDKSVDLVFHLAAVTKDSEFKKNLSYCLDVNITGTLAVLDYCTQNNSGCVFASTSGVYKRSDSVINVDESYPLEPLSLYAASKFIGEKLCQRYSTNFNVPITILRIFNPYGIGQKEPFLAPYIINRLLDGSVIKLRMPDAIRDFIYVNDVVDAIILAGEKIKNELNIYNIGSGLPIKVIEFVNFAKEVFDIEPRIEVIGGEDFEPNQMLANNKKAVNDLGIELKTDLKEGLEIIKNTYGDISSWSKR